MNLSKISTIMQRQFGCFCLFVLLIGTVFLVDYSGLINKTSSIRRRLKRIISSSASTVSSGRIEYQHHHHQRRRLSVITNTGKIKHQLKIATDESKKSSHPLTAVIHVGPEKTGTSSIQHTIRGLQKNGLLLDQYMLANIYFTNYQPRKFTDCFVTNGSRYIENKNECDETVVHNIELISKQYHSNMIMSTEYLFPPNVNLKKLHKFLSSNWNDVHIVMYYRRYFEWFISLHTQGSRVRPIYKRISILQHLRHEIQYETDIKDKYVIGVMKRYQKHFKNVRIQNVHSGTDVRELFFCGNVIPNSNHTCDAYHKQVHKEHQAIHPSKRNTRNSLIYQEIAYHAKLLNMIDYKDNRISSANDKVNNSIMSIEPKYTFDEITSKIQHYHESVLGLNEYDFPTNAIACPNEYEYEWLYNKSLEYELLLFPQYHMDIGLLEIQNLFATSKQNLCHVNATAILYHDEMKWIEFFRTIT